MCWKGLEHEEELVNYLDFHLIGDLVCLKIEKEPSVARFVVWKPFVCYEGTRPGVTLLCDLPCVW